MRLRFTVVFPAPGKPMRKRAWRLQTSRCDAREERRRERDGAQSPRRRSLNSDFCREDLPFVSRLRGLESSRQRFRKVCVTLRKLVRDLRRNRRLQSGSPLRSLRSLRCGQGQSSSQDADIDFLLQLCGLLSDGSCPSCIIVQVRSM
mmetsp:Transcript_70609/g.153352  ORF Transcript_70609/g.153352 Transcript_70609/m.153352 type:complete len:147 (-) Transcript_70609:95-535(-)